MNKRYILVLSLILILMLVLSFTAQSQERFVAHIIVSSGEVQLLRDGTEQWVHIGMESIVGMGDKVRTLDDGIADLEILNEQSRLQIEPNSEIQINQLQSAGGEQTISITLSRGAMAGIVNSDDGKAIFEITLPGLTFLTRASIINTWVSDDEFSNVITSSGGVYVLVNDDLVEIQEGQGISAARDGKLARSLPSASREQLTLLRQGIVASFSVTSDTQLNVRKGPSIASELIGTIPPVDIIRVYATDVSGAWYRIDYNDGYGWISSQNIDSSINDSITNLLAQFPSTYIEPESSGFELVQESAEDASVERPAVLDFMNLEELEVLAHINQWRMGVGLAPLMPNETLAKMAEGQATYLSTLPSIPADVHQDAQGRNEDGRGLDPMYAWPHYLTAERIALGENTWIGANMQSAINFWQTSTIHRQTVENPAYREAGIGVVPSQFGRVHVLVLGARPNIFPVFVDTINNQLILTKEQYRYADPGDWIINVERFQIVESGFGQLVEENWISWTPTIEIPQLVEFAITFEGGGKQVSLPINLYNSIAWLPENLPTDQNELPEIGVESESQADSGLPEIPPSTGDTSLELTEEPLAMTATPTSAPQTSIFPTNTPLPSN